MDRLVLPATLDALVPVREFIERAACSARLNDKATYAMQLALDEIVTNIATHGSLDHPTPSTIEICATAGEAGLQVIIEDTGPGYQPADNLTPSHVGQPLEQRPVGGLGLFLARQCVDSFQYERLGHRNRHTLYVRSDRNGVADNSG